MGDGLPASSVPRAVGNGSTVQTTADDHRRNAEALAQKTFASPPQTPPAPDPLPKPLSDGQNVVGYVINPSGATAAAYVQLNGRAGERIYYCPTGSGIDGMYVPAHIARENGAVTVSTDNVPQVSFRDPQELVSLLGLTKNSDNVSFSRPGFTGQYYVQKQPDGHYTVFYTGGYHVAERNGWRYYTPMGAQTLEGLVWDVRQQQPKGQTTPAAVITGTLRVPSSDTPGARSSRGATFPALPAGITGSRPAPASSPPTPAAAPPIDVPTEPVPLSAEDLESLGTR